MKKIKSIFSCLLILAVAASCSTPDSLEDDLGYLEGASSSNTDRIFDISNDNTGLVKITPVGEGVSSFTVMYGHGSSGPVTLTPGQSTSHNYPEGSYTVTIVSTDIAGHQTTTQYPLQLTYRVPEDLDINATVNGLAVGVSATADYANSFLVYFGDVPGEVGTPMLVGQTLPPHTYAAAGTYTITVVALSGGAATTQLTEQIVVYNPYSLPITYEDINQNYSIGGTFGGVGVAKVANPFPGGINTSATVWQYTKPSGAEVWSGTWTPLSAPNGTPINIDNGHKIKVMVYSTEIGKKLNVEIEQGTNGVSNKVLQVASTVANQWEELVFDFGVYGIPAGTTFSQLVFRYNDVAPGAGEVIYIDNVTQSN